ncbi:MAG: ABC transporter permease [archaeon]|nr:ABC transporter permease [archaeon]
MSETPRDKRNHRRLTTLSLAWLAISRRKRRSIISIVLLSFVIGSSITIGSTIGRFPTWVSALSTTSPTVLLTYERSSPLVGLIPANSTIPLSDQSAISSVSGVSDVTPLIVKDIHTSLSDNPSLVVGLDINFWQLSLGLNKGHWPEPNSSQAVIAVSNPSANLPSSLTIGNESFEVVGVALTSDLILVDSVIISYTTAQTLFSLEHSTSIFLIQVNSRADPSIVSNQIDQIDPALETIDLSSSAQLLNTVTEVVSSISNTVVLAEAIFAFVILTTLTISSINTRRWEYGLVSSYAGRTSVFKMILFENWIIFVLAIIPAFSIGIGVLGYFTYYFNLLFGIHVSADFALGAANQTLLGSTTLLLNYTAAFVATTLGSILAIMIVLPKIISRALVDQQA